MYQITLVEQRIGLLPDKITLANQISMELHFLASSKTTEARCLYVCSMVPCDPKKSSVIRTLFHCLASVTIRASMHKLEKKITFYVTSFQAPIQGHQDGMVRQDICNCKCKCSWACRRNRRLGIFQLNQLNIFPFQGETTYQLYFRARSNINVKQQ